MRWRTFILCLLLAMLPLRGWAQAVMQTSMAAAGTAAPMPVPCHPSAMGKAGTDAPTGPAHDLGCTTCDLCCAACVDVAPVALVTAPPTVQRVASPALAGIGSHSAGRLERPPRRR